MYHPRHSDSDILSITLPVLITITNTNTNTCYCCTSEVTNSTFKDGQIPKRLVQ